MPDHYETELMHLIKMASIPGFKEYAWHEAKRLDACASGLWCGIAHDLKTAMLAKKGVTA